MTEDEYRLELRLLADQWGPVYVDEFMPGYVRSTKDATTGILVGFRASLMAEIINRALKPYTGPTECYCTTHCMAPRIMGKQTGCLRDPPLQPGQAILRTERPS